MSRDYFLHIFPRCFFRLYRGAKLILIRFLVRVHTTMGSNYDDYWSSALWAACQHHLAPRILRFFDRYLCVSTCCRIVGLILQTHGFCSLGNPLETNVCHSTVNCWWCVSFTTSDGSSLSFILSLFLFVANDFACSVSIVFLPLVIVAELIMSFV